MAYVWIGGKSEGDHNSATQKAAATIGGQASPLRMRTCAMEYGNRPSHPKGKPGWYGVMLQRLPTHSNMCLD